MKKLSLWLVGFLCMCVVILACGVPAFAAEIPSEDAPVSSVSSGEASTPSEPVGPAAEAPAPSLSPPAEPATSEEASEPGSASPSEANSEPITEEPEIEGATESPAPSEGSAPADPNDTADDEPADGSEPSSASVAEETPVDEPPVPDAAPTQAPQPSEASPANGVAPAAEQPAAAPIPAEEPLPSAPHAGNLAAFASSSPVEIPKLNEKPKSNRNGWITENGKRYYYKNGEKQTGWVKVGGKSYYFNPKTKTQQTEYVKVNGRTFYLDPKQGGAVKKGFIDVPGYGRVFVTTNYEYATGWVVRNGKRYYLDPETGAVRTGIQVVDGKRYYFDPELNGAMAKGFVEVAGYKGRLYFKSDGSAIDGWFNVRGNRYYAKPGTNRIQYGHRQDDKGYHMWLDKHKGGAAAKGLVSIPKVGTVYVTSRYRNVAGWVSVAGRKYYADPSTRVMVTGTRTIKGKVYQFDPVGRLIGQGGKGSKMEHGIDVSAHQGVIDWAKVKASGKVDFAIIRALTWNKNTNSYEIDPYFDANVRGAKAHGIAVGVYIFSYAFNNAEMAQEVNFFVNHSVVKKQKADGIRYDLPVYIDFEYAPALAHNPTVAGRTDMLRHGMNLLRKNGYQAGFYSSYSWATTHYDARQLIKEGYDFWMARYYDNQANKSPNQHGWSGTGLSIWQYSSRASVPGIKGNVDVNHCYKNYSSGNTVPGSVKVTVYDTVSGKEVTDTIDNLVGKMVQYELGGRAHKEATKAQAVASRTWLLHMFSNSEKLPVVGLRKASKAVKNAVKATANEIILYEGSPILAVWSASNSGATNSASGYWQNHTLPYLAGRADAYGATHTNQTTVIGTDSYNGQANSGIRYAIQQMTGKAPRGNPANWIKLTKNSAGYVTSVNVCGTEVRADTFFENTKGLLSPNIVSLTYDADTKNWTFVTNGEGHGVGMSKAGAVARAKKGATYKQILRFYYSGTTFGKAGG